MAKKLTKEKIFIPEFDLAEPQYIFAGSYYHIIRVGKSKSGHDIAQRFGGHIYNEEFRFWDYTIKLRAQPFRYERDKRQPWNDKALRRGYYPVDMDSAANAITNNDPSLLVYLNKSDTECPIFISDQQVGIRAWEEYAEKRKYYLSNPGDIRGYIEFKKIQKSKLQ